MSTAYVPSAADRRGEPEEISVGRDSLAEGRRRVFWFATHAGLGSRRAGDLVLAVNELLTNSIRHGGGVGVLRLWSDGDSVSCEVRDRGRLLDPRAGRRRPSPDQAGGRGLWIVHQLCDLVQIRALEDGTAVRVSMRRA